MYISIDVGGTSTRIATTKNLKKIDSIIRYDTIQNFNDAKKKLYSEIEKLVGKAQVKKIIFGIPGTVDKKQLKVLKAPNLIGWKNKSLQDFYKNAEIFIENDTHLGGLGEVHFGKEDLKNSIVAYIAVGTGVGGCRLIHGHLDFSNGGFEPGHQIISQQNFKNHKCPTTLEEFVSGPSIEKHFKITRSGQSKDEHMWAIVGDYLASGLVNITVLWKPDVIILGGGVLDAGNYLIRPTKIALKEQLSIFKPPKIKRATLRHKGIGAVSNIFGGFHVLQSTIK